MLAMESRISSLVAMISSPPWSVSAASAAASVVGVGGFGGRLGRCVGGEPRQMASGAASASAASAAAASARGGLGRRRLGRGASSARAPGAPPCSISAWQAVGEVAGHGLEQAGELLHRGGHGAGERASSSSRGATSASALASAAVSSLSPSTPPLTTRVGLVLAKSRSALATVTGSSAVDEGDGGRPGQQVLDLEAEVAGGEAHERVLVDLVARRRRRAASGAASAMLGHVEPAVLGEQGGVGWPSRRSRTSSTTATFSGLGFSIAPPFLSRSAHRPAVRSGCGCHPEVAEPAPGTTQGARACERPGGQSGVFASSGGPGPVRRPEGHRRSSASRASVVGEDGTRPVGAGEIRSASSRHRVRPRRRRRRRRTCGPGRS